MPEITPPPPVNIAAHFPWLGDFAAEAVRLHPRRRPNLPVHSSKMGGLFFWPREVPWPVCRARDARAAFDFSRPDKLAAFTRFLEQAQHLEEMDGLDSARGANWSARASAELEELDRRSRLVHHQPYLPLLQLCRQEFPGFPFPPGTDLFQLLWCPHLHFAGPPDEPPGFLAFWRRQDDIADPLLQEPPLAEGLELFECRLTPEPVLEYPVSGAFEPHFAQDLEFLFSAILAEGASGAALYDSVLSAAPGVKLYGYPRWIGPPATPSCACGRRMALLVTVDTSETGSGPDSVLRWGSAEPEPQSHGLSFATRGALYLFYCDRCRGPRLRAVVRTED